MVQAFLRCDAVGFEERRKFARRLGLDIICLSPVHPAETTTGGLPTAAEVTWPDLERWAIPGPPGSRCGGFGKTGFFHSDGNLDDLLADMVKAGFHGLQCLEAAAGMDIGQIERQYGNRLCLWGNLDPEELILPRSRSALRNTVQALIDVASPGGGFIFGTSSGMFKEMRVENLQAVYGVCCSSL